MKKRGVLFFFVFLLNLFPALAATEGDPYQPVKYLIYVIYWIVILSVYILVKDRIKKLGETEKKVLFWIFTIPVVVITLYMAAHTVHKNINSITKGPIHWHSDYEVWICGEQQDLIDPKFPKNKIGSPLYHEHNDNRLHIEGTVTSWDEANMGKYFELIGGELTDSSLKYPLNEGKMVDVKNGDTCGDQPATLKIYLNGQLYPTGFAEYVMYPDPYVPPGDCFIIEFSPGDAAPTTDKICDAWEARDVNYENLDRPSVTVGDRSW